MLTESRSQRRFWLKWVTALTHFQIQIWNYVSKDFSDALIGKTTGKKLKAVPPSEGKSNWNLAVSYSVSYLAQRAAPDLSDSGLWHPAKNHLQNRISWLLQSHNRNGCRVWITGQIALKISWYCLFTLAKSSCYCQATFKCSFCWAS
jgi:hypothetical protein